MATMVTRNKIILKKRGDIAKLCKEFNCSHMTIYNALNFANSSDKSQKIRHKAVNEMGAKIVTFKDKI